MYWAENENFIIVHKKKCHFNSGNYILVTPDQQAVFFTSEIHTYFTYFPEIKRMMS